MHKKVAITAILLFKQHLAQASDTRSTARGMGSKGDSIKLAISTHSAVCSVAKTDLAQEKRHRSRFRQLHRRDLRVTVSARRPPWRERGTEKQGARTAKPPRSAAGRAFVTWLQAGYRGNVRACAFSAACASQNHWVRSEFFRS